METASGPIPLGSNSLSAGLLEQQAPRGFALSNKVTSILSASYADIEIRDALETLDSRNIKNTSETRKNLRRDVQREIIDVNGEIVDDFGGVARQLKSVGVALHSLQKTCAEIRKHVSSARMETKPMLDEAKALVAQKKQVETKQNVLQSFNSHFLLSEEETRTLTSGAQPVDDTFFLSLVKAKKIHKDSRLLLGSENQRLGLEILDQSSKNLNAAFQKLYRWIQREFKTLDLENPRINTSIRRALRVLAERPSLFQNCLDIFAESRERSLSNAFYAALTGSAHGGEATLKPIDMSASEPLRYVGDMLAWVHSITVSEREALEGLFISEGDEIAKGIEEGLESEPWLRADTEDANEESGEGDEQRQTSTTPQPTFDGRTALAQLVNRSLAGVAHLLRERIEQVVHSHDEPVLCYKIANLVAFYRSIFSRLVNESGFLETLDKIEASALDRFGTTMRFAVSNLQAEVTSAPDDLSAPDFLAGAMDALGQLVKSYETSLASSFKAPSATSPDDETGPPGLQTLFAEALDPYVTTLRTLASALPTPTSTSVFLHNSIGLVLATLQPHTPLTQSKLAHFQTAQAAQLADLTADTHVFLLTTSGLAPLLAALPQHADDDNPDEAVTLAPLLSAGSPFAPATLAVTSTRLDDFLPNAVIDAEARLGALRDKRALGEVVRRAAEGFVQDFERVEDVVERLDEMDADAGEDGKQEDEEDDGDRGKRRRVWPRTTEEVAVLLS